MAACAVALLAAAYLIAKGTVTAADGTRCGSVWRAANGSLSFTGERTVAEVDLARASCREVARPLVRTAYAVGAAGGALGAIAAVYYVASVRPGVRAGLGR